MRKVFVFLFLIIFVSSCAPARQQLPGIGPLPGSIECSDDSECRRFHPQGECVQPQCAPCMAGLTPPDECRCPKRCVWPEAPAREGPVACTEEAKICPDGSAVGRVGPNCEFAPCPQRESSYCNSDADCVCDGYDPRAEKCFVGNRQYYEVFVDKERDCPDFCTGIAGDRGTKCVENQCVILRLEKPLPVAPRILVEAVPGYGEAPLVANITAVLRNAEPNDKRFYCAAQKWDFGDGNVQEALPSCVPWFPEANVPARYTTMHRFERPGYFNVTFTLGGLKSSPAAVAVIPELLPPECDEASDCAKAQCCHAADCVMKEKVPDCSRTMCTMNCMPGTLDCGGSCACIAGRCTGQNFFPGEVSREKPMPWGVI